MGDKPLVFIFSDSVGETAEFVVKAVASQFNSGEIDIRREAFINDPKRLQLLIREASRHKAMIVYTFVLPQLRQVMREEAAKLDIPCVDVLGPMLQAFSKIMNVDPRLEAGLVRRLDEGYFRRVTAVEFAVKHDDGKDPRGLIQADVVLIGVSRTSKTPLSMYLAHRKFKAANLPLVPEVEPPQELFAIPASKIIGLTIEPEKLQQIRRERLHTLGLDAQASYASLDRILEELDYADKIMKKIGCPIFDVSNKAVEEVASRILQLLKEGKNGETI